MRINESKVARVFEEERKACGGFGSEKIKDFEIKNTACLARPLNLAAMSDLRAGV